MTLLEKHQALLDDLLEDYDNTTEVGWKWRLEQKIADLREAIARLK